MEGTYQNNHLQAETYTLKVYNTMTNEYEDVSVTREVYEAYRRTEWNIKDNDRSYYDYEIQWSGLIGGEDDQFENFKEFIQEETPEIIVLQAELHQALSEIMSELDEEDRKMVNALYVDGISEREYARLIDIPQKTLNCRKLSFLCKFSKNKFAQKPNIFPYTSEKRVFPLLTCSFTTPYSFSRYIPVVAVVMNRQATERTLDHRITPCGLR